MESFDIVLKEEISCNYVDYSIKEYRNKSIKWYQVVPLIWFYRKVNNIKVPAAVTMDQKRQRMITWSNTGLGGIILAFQTFVAYSGS
jgi:hypothetical protein